MTQKSAVWPNNGVNDASPHSVADSLLFMAVLSGQSFGVVRGLLGSLSPQASGGNILVEAGGGMSAGHPYYNDAQVSITPTIPSTNTTGRRVVLHTNPSASGGQTVRLVEISSADGTATIPSYDTDYETPICEYTVTTGGVIAAFKDDRVFIGAPLRAARALATAFNVTGSVTLADVTGLVVPVAASRRYLVRIRASLSFSTEGIKVGIGLPSGGAFIVDGYQIINDATIIDIHSTSSPLIDRTSTVYEMIDFAGVVTIGATAGNISVQVAQHTSTGVNTGLLAGATLEVTEIVE